LHGSIATNGKHMEWNKQWFIELFSTMFISGSAHPIVRHPLKYWNELVGLDWDSAWFSLVYMSAWHNKSLAKVISKKTYYWVRISRMWESLTLTSRSDFYLEENDGFDQNSIEDLIQFNKKSRLMWLSWCIYISIYSLEIKMVIWKVCLTLWEK
jgi:hypothetical protein